MISLLIIRPAPGKKADRLVDGEKKGAHLYPYLTPDSALPMMVYGGDEMCLWTGITAGILIARATRARTVVGLILYIKYSRHRLFMSDGSWVMVVVLCSRCRRRRKGQHCTRY